MKCEKLIKTAAVVALILFIAGAVIGTLAVPVVLSMFYSWYWLFLYAGYLFVILYVALYCIRYSYEEHINNGGKSYGSNFGDGDAGTHMFSAPALFDADQKIWRVGSTDESSFTVNALIPLKDSDGDFFVTHWMPYPKLPQEGT